MNVGLLLVLIGGLILTVGDIVFKNWAINNSWLTFIFGLFIWTIGLVFLALSFKYKNRQAHPKLLENALSEVVVETPTS